MNPVPFLLGTLAGLIICLTALQLILDKQRREFSKDVVRVLGSIRHNSILGISLKNFSSRQRSFREVKQMINEIKSANRDNQEAVKAVLGRYYDFFIMIKL